MTESVIQATRRRINDLLRADKISPAQHREMKSRESKLGVGFNRLATQLRIDHGALLELHLFIECRATRHLCDEVSFGPDLPDGTAHCTETCTRCRTERKSYRSIRDYDNRMTPYTYHHPSGYDFEGMAKNMRPGEFRAAQLYFYLLEEIGELEKSQKTMSSDNVVPHRRRRA